MQKLQLLIFLSYLGKINWGGGGKITLPPTTLPPRLGLRYLNFFLKFFPHVRKRLDKKTAVNFKILDIKNWVTKNYNKHIARYLKK